MLSTASIVYEFCGTWYGLITMATTSPKAADFTIIITGKPGTGKTTLVQAFQEFLQQRGFKDVSVLDPDLDPSGHGRRPSGSYGVRLAAIAERNPSVCIAAVMAPKGRPSPQPAPCHEELF